MIRTLFLVLTLLAVTAMPGPVFARGGGHAGHGHHHGHHHHGHHRFHHFGGFVVVPYPYDPYFYYPYPYYYPYSVYSSAVVVEPPRLSIRRRQSSVKWSTRTGSTCSMATA